MNTNTEDKPTPITTEELGDAIWKYYQAGESFAQEEYSDALNQLLTAGKLELAVELMKYNALDKIVGYLDKITVEGITIDPDQLQYLSNAIENS